MLNFSGQSDGIKWPTVLGELSAHKHEIAAQLVKLHDWLSGATKSKDHRGVLIIGSGGVGKSTTGRFLSGDGVRLAESTGKYDESLGAERYLLDDDPNVELIVPPGQKHRRDATWGQLQQTISAGGYRGIILPSSYGYHSLGQISYKHHRLYKGEKAAFMEAFLNECQADELAVLNRLSPHFSASDRKFWVVSLVTKQDLWWDRRSEVESHYREGKYGRLMAQITKRIGPDKFRHEAVFTSFVISNFTTGHGEVLATTVAGYDHNHQAESLRRFVNTLDGLRQWEASR